MTDPKSDADLAACLPIDLRLPSTTITKMTVGLSGAGVYRVEAGGQSFVLKTSPPEQAPEAWRRILSVHQLAAGAGLAPPVVHVEEGRRAVVSAFVVDHAFPALYGTPGTRDLAIAKLGQMLRRMHELPVPGGLAPAQPRAFLGLLWSEPMASFAVPAFVREAVEQVLSEVPPAGTRPLVLSHNDVNPTNLIYDGDRLLMLDWETAAPNDPFYDLAVVANFLRMNEPAALALLAAYGEPVTILPDPFRYLRRLSAALVGGLFLDLARRGGHPGAAMSDTRDTTASLGEVYAGMRDGSVSVATPDGQWRVGLAMIKDGCTT